MAEKDRRFGGNLARATEGAQYPSGLVRGQSGNIRVPMVDARYEDYQAPHRVDYTSPRGPIQTGTPNFRPPSEGGMREGIEQIPSGNYLQNYFNMIRNQAFGPEGPLTSGLSQDWKRIYAETGNEDLANEWVASQQNLTADASDWIDYIPSNPFSNKLGELPLNIDPFEGSIGYDKQFDLPFGGTGNIGADYDLEDQRLKTGIMGNWTWG